MAIAALKAPKFNPPRESVVTWNTWRKGLNLLLRENEIDKAEAVTLTNMILVGSGVPIKRWGSQTYFSTSSNLTDTSRFVMAIKDNNDSQQVISLSDSGLMVKRNDEAGFDVVAGASWASGAQVEGTQLGGNVYLVSQAREMIRYNFNTLVAFASLTAPGSVVATNISGATGTYTWSWRITATGKSGGETLGSTNISLASLPQDLTKTLIKVTWASVSAASGDLVGYNIYRGDPGSEHWIGGVGPLINSFTDYGNTSNDLFRVVPTANTTGGPKAKFVIRYQDRLILAGIPGEPTKLLVSGRYPYQERFDWYSGGGYVMLEPDSGENITGLGIHQEKLVVFKENSVWQVALNSIQFGNYLILEPTYKLLTASQGCSSHRSICPVENDLMFSNDKGVYILRYEPQLLTVINANEISAKIQPFFDSLSIADKRQAAAVYANKKYILSFPISKKTIVFDRERLAFTGPWTTPYGIRQWEKFVDSAGTERIIGADSNDCYITEFNSGYPDDKGSGILTVFKSRKEDFGDWTIFKTINEMYMNFRSLVGQTQVNIYLEDREGNAITAKSFTVAGVGSSGTSGFGTDMFGVAQLGSTNNVIIPVAGETPKKAFIYKTSRTFQVEIRTSDKTSSYELLGIKAVATPQARGNSPSIWNV